MSTLITGAAGFIGSNLVHHLLDRWPQEPLVSLDSLTYSGNLASLGNALDNPRHTFVEANITDDGALRQVFEHHDITQVMHLAAESHVDRSIVDPLCFVRTNVLGTAALLQEASSAWAGRSDVRFLHVSTDEVFGSLGSDGKFTEQTPYDPRSPYSASKAASDHLVRAWHETYEFPALITNCTNNYGPFQFPEKLIPVVLTNAMERRPVPVYGDGSNVRDWLFVRDHCEALALVLSNGTIGSTYCVGGETEADNLTLVRTLLDEYDALAGNDAGTSRELITFVTDRPGHDFRYAMDISKIRDELGWQPAVSLTEGLRETIQWYLDNGEWLAAVTKGDQS